MDYRRFLSRRETRVLPYFGGKTVDAPDRRLRVPEEGPPGWWTFEIEGRIARRVAPAEPVGLGELPACHGHLLERWLVLEGAKVEEVQLLPAEQALPLSPVTARRWCSGELLFQSVDFESEVEEAVRRALEEGRTLEGLKGVPATLTSAFGLAVIFAASRRLAIPVAPVEVRRQLGQIAMGSAALAEELLRGLAQERQRHRFQRALRSAVRSADRPAPEQTDEERAAAALEAAGARLLGCRRIAGDVLEVRYRLEGARFISLVHPVSLQVIDAGICLAGADAEVTLESLPSVIREAMDQGLVYTRHDD
jgi:hypothetical protein